MPKKKEKKRMTKQEIEELLSLKGWTKTKLAAELDLKENTVHRWLHLSRNPSGPAAILMRMWLREAREAREAREEEQAKSLELKLSELRDGGLLATTAAASPSPEPQKVDA